MCAYVRVTGEDFDVDRFLGDSTIEPDRVFHRGEPKKRRAENWSCSGFGLEIGGAFGRLGPQIAEASAFVKEFRDELDRLSHFPGVSYMGLFFSYCPGNRSNVTEYFPPEFLKPLGSIGMGIELDVYPGDNKWLDEEHVEEDS